MIRLQTFIRLKNNFLRKEKMNENFSTKQEFSIISRLVIIHPVNWKPFAKTYNQFIWLLNLRSLKESIH